MLFQYHISQNYNTCVPYVYLHIVEHGWKYKLMIRWIVLDISLNSWGVTERCSVRITP